MKRLLRLIQRKRNIRRLIAAGFFLIAVVEIGSHAFMDSLDPAASQELTECRVQENAPIKADCPDNQKNRGPESNLKDELTSHCMILSQLSVPFNGIMYRTEMNFASNVRTLSRSLTPPFHPPKQV